ncbi:MAG: hypothetical protein LBH01_09160 [Verrucomicrobiales bacterium]|jgi:hypothetical protein|nr:hypothetical protein [Verrucomicrobiales bacterium]
MELSPWLLRLERRFGHWGIPHLIKGLVVLNCLTFVLQYLQPGFEQMLSFDSAAIRAGEVWRVFTFLLQPAVLGNWGMLWFLLAMWFLWFIGDGLENALGPFLLNLYLLLGVVAVSVVALTLYPYAQIPNSYILLSFLFGFATFYPDTPILLFFVIEVKIKYIAIFFAACTALTAILSPVLLPVILASLTGYLVFFGPWYFRYLRMRLDSRRRMKKFKGED